MNIKKTCVLLGMLLLIGPSGFGQGNPPSRPNVLFVISDDQSLSEFNFFAEGRNEDGSPKNLHPNLSRLKKEGVFFSQAYCATTVCVPTRFNSMTGMHASRATNHEFLSEGGKQPGRWKSGQTRVGWNTHVTPETQSIQHILKDNGYTTGFVGKNHVIEHEGSPKVGPDADPSDPVVLERLRNYHDKTADVIRRCGFDYANGVVENLDYVNYGKALDYHNLDYTVDIAQKFMRSVKGKPWFLWFSTTLMHGPFKERLFPSDPLVTPLGKLEQPLSVMPSREDVKRRVMEAGIEPTWQSCGVTWLDDGIGALMDELKRQGSYDNTIIIFTTDQGVDQGSKGSLYQGGIRIPIIIWAPKRFKGGSTIQNKVQTVDFLPTILDCCGIAPPESTVIDGVSLRPMLAGRDKPLHESLYFEMGNTRAVIKGKYKYLALRHPPEIINMPMSQRKVLLDRRIRSCKQKTGKDYHIADPATPFGHVGLRPGGTGPTQKCIRYHPHYYDPDQLYDLEKDPGEKNNLAANPEYAEMLTKMKTEMIKYLNDLPGPFGELKPE